MNGEWPLTADKKLGVSLWRDLIECHVTTLVIGGHALKGRLEHKDFNGQRNYRVGVW